MKTPWPAMMQAAARAGVGPQRFWQLSVREWRMLTAVPDQARPMGRAEMNSLSEAFPDER